MLQGTPDILEHSIILSHYGFAGVDTACDAYGWVHNYDHCRHAAGGLPCYNPAKVWLRLRLTMRTGGSAGQLCALLTLAQQGPYLSLHFQL